MTLPLEPPLLNVLEINPDTMLLERYPGKQKALSTVSPLHIEIEITQVCLGPELGPFWLVWPTSQNSR